MNTLFDIFVYIIFMCISVFGLVYSVCDSKKILLQRLNNLRGLFALEIIIGHVVRYEKSMLYPFGIFMIISVAFFFFVSGFGMVVSKECKSDYFQGFLIKKPIYILIIALFYWVINSFIDIILPIDYGYVVKGENIANLFWSNTNWYMFELIIIYIVFYISHKYLKKYQLLTCIVSLLVLMHLFYYNGFSQAWYSSTLAFPLGVLFGKKYDRVIKFMRTKQGIFMTLVLFVLGMFSLRASKQSVIEMIYLKNAICLAGILLMVYCLLFFDIGNNKVCKWLTKYSLELYLSQFVLLKIFASVDYKFRLIAVIAGCVIMSMILHPVLDSIRRQLNASQKKGIMSR